MKVDQAKSHIREQLGPCTGCGTMLPYSVHAAGNALYDGAAFTGQSLAEHIEREIKANPRLQASINAESQRVPLFAPTVLTDEDAVDRAISRWLYESQHPDFDDTDLAAAVQHWGSMDGFYDSKCQRIAVEGDNAAKADRAPVQSS